VFKAILARQQFPSGLLRDVARIRQSKTLLLLELEELVLQPLGAAHQMRFQKIIDWLHVLVQAGLVQSVVLFLRETRTYLTFLSGFVEPLRGLREVLGREAEQMIERGDTSLQQVQEQLLTGLLVSKSGRHTLASVEPRASKREEALFERQLVLELL